MAMSAKNLFYPEDKSFSNAEERAYAREDLVYNVTEDILIALEDLNITKKELARKLGKSKSYVTQVLSGARNMTLGSMSDICFALGIEPKVTINVQPAKVAEYLQTEVYLSSTISESTWSTVQFSEPKETATKVLSISDHPKWGRAA